MHLWLHWRLSVEVSRCSREGRREGDPSKASQEAPPRQVQILSSTVAVMVGGGDCPDSHVGA